MKKLILCRGCGTQNRISGFRLNAIPRCGRCGANLPEPTQIMALRFAKHHWAWFILFGFIGAIVLIDFLPASDNRQSRQYVASCQSVPINAGIFRRYSYREAVAPFRVVTSEGANYFIKLVDKHSQQPEITMFVYGGLPIEIEVPIGTYELRYAYGKTWCGENYLFGEDTSYGMADADFSFQINNGKISGYTVELIPRVHGNLKTRSISGASF